MKIYVACNGTHRVVMYANEYAVEVKFKNGWLAIPRAYSDKQSAIRACNFFAGR